MKKRIIGIVFAAVFVLLFGVSFAGCKPDRSEIEEGIYSFREAYEIGLLTREDVMHVSYFMIGRVYEGKEAYNSETWEEIDFTPTKEECELTAEEETVVKGMYYQKNKKLFEKYGYMTEEEAREIIHLTFYGEYEGAYVVARDVNFPGEENPSPAEVIQYCIDGIILPYLPSVYYIKKEI